MMCCPPFIDWVCRQFNLHKSLFAMCIIFAAIDDAGIVSASASTPTKPIVREIQLMLEALGYYPGPIDGTMGELTTAAVTKYRADRALTATGPLTPAGIAELRTLAGDRRFDKLSKVTIGKLSFSALVKGGTFVRSTELEQNHTIFNLIISLEGSQLALCSSAVTNSPSKQTFRVTDGAVEVRLAAIGDSAPIGLEIKKLKLNVVADSMPGSVWALSGGKLKQKTKSVEIWNNSDILLRPSASSGTLKIRFSPGSIVSNLQIRSGANSFTLTSLRASDSIRGAVDLSTCGFTIENGNFVSADAKIAENLNIDVTNIDAKMRIATLQCSGASVNFRGDNSILQLSNPKFYNVNASTTSGKAYLPVTFATASKLTSIAQITERGLEATTWDASDYDPRIESVSLIDALRNGTDDLLLPLSAGGGKRMSVKDLREMWSRLHLAGESSILARISGSNLDYVLSADFHPVPTTSRLHDNIRIAVLEMEQSPRYPVLVVNRLLLAAGQTAEDKIASTIYNSAVPTQLSSPDRWAPIGEIAYSDGSADIVLALLEDVASQGLRAVELVGDQPRSVKISLPSRANGVGAREAQLKDGIRNIFTKFAEETK